MDNIITEITESQNVSCGSFYDQEANMCTVSLLTCITLWAIMYAQGKGDGIAR